MNRISLCAVAAVIVFGAASVAHGAGHRPIIYSGELMADNGLPYTGSVMVSVKAWDTPEMGTELWSQDATAVDVVGGVLDIELGMGDQAPLMAILAGGTEVWLSFTIDGETLNPRQEMTAHPYAAVAGNALRLAGMMPSAFVQSGDPVSAQEMGMAPADPAPGQLWYDSGSQILNVWDSGVGAWVAATNGPINAEQLPTDGINDVSNGALKNKFMDVSHSWSGSKEILDAEPVNPPAGATHTLTTGEGPGSYLTGVALHTVFSLNFVSEIRIVFTPPSLSGLAPIELRSELLLPGEYDDMWTIATTPELAGLLGSQAAGGWTVTLDDLDNTAAASPAIGVFTEFEVLYDVVRADHMIVDGRLDVTGNLNVGGDINVDGNVFQRLNVATFAAPCQTGYTGSAWIQCGSGRTLTFDKVREDTKLRVSWHDNLRCRNVGGAQCEWQIRIDGQDCTSPKMMVSGLYSNPADNNLHIPGHHQFFCAATADGPIGAGEHTLTVWVRSQNGAETWTGWGANGGAYENWTSGHLSAEEVYY